MPSHDERSGILNEAVSICNLGSKTWGGLTYKNVFTGESLVNVLMKDNTTFPARETAVQYSQELLDTRVIMCITKRGTFDDSDRLYYINQNDTKTHKIPSQKKFMAKFPTEKKKEEKKKEEKKKEEKKKEEKKKEPSKESPKVNGFSSHDKNVCSVGKERLQLSGTKPSANLQRLIDKDYRTHSNSKSAMEDVKLEKRSADVVFKDDHTKADNDEKLTQTINTSLNKSAPDKTQFPPEKADVVFYNISSSLGNTDGTSKTSGVGNSSQGCLLDRGKVKSGLSRQYMTEKDKVSKTFSPALSALIEKDEKSNRLGVKVARKPEETNARETGKSKAQETTKAQVSVDVSNATAAGNEDTDKLSNSWDAFELKLQNKIKKTSPRKTAGAESNPIDGVHENSVTTLERISLDSNNRVKKSVDEPMPSSATQSIGVVSPREGISSPKEKIPVESNLITTKSMFEAKDKEHDKLVGKSEETVTFSIDPNKNVFVKKPDLTVSKKDSLKVQNKWSSDSSAKSSRKSSFLSDDEGSKMDSTRGKVPSFMLNDNKKTIIMGQPGNENRIRSGSDLSIVTKNTGVSRERGPSFNHGESKVVIIEDKPAKDFKPNSGVLNTKEERSSSFTKDSDNTPESKVLITGDPVQSPKIPSSDNENNNSLATQEELVVISGHSIPKALAALIAKDSVGLEERKERPTDDESKITKYNLKEQIKASPQSSIKTTSLSSVEPQQANQTFSSSETELVETPALRSNSVEGKAQGFSIQRKTSHGTTNEHKVPTGTSPESGGTLEDKPLNSKSQLVTSLSPSYNTTRLNLTPDSPERSPPVSITRPTSLHITTDSHFPDSPSELRKELQRSRLEFQERQQTYENQITELQLQLDYLRRQKSGQIQDNNNDLNSSASTSDLSSLYSNFSTPMISPGNSTSPSITPVGTPRGSITGESLILSPRSPPPPPPFPPSIPPAPSPMSPVKLNKPVVNPQVDMKPLFWSRIISTEGNNRSSKSLWRKIKEPAIDTNEFEKLFSKKSGDRTLKRTKSLRDDKHFTRINGKKVAKLLDSNRSRAIGIKMSSLNCQLDDIRKAVYNMDTSVVDMESLQFIYDIYPKENEIQIIQQHVSKVPHVPLDKPEEFIYQLMMMKHFKERLECWLFEEKFNEVIISIDRSLTCVTESCSTITTNAEVTCIIAFVLAYGNYMNGNTVRGQADGFNLDVLLKLRDVKAKDSDVSLLHYIVKQYLKQYDRSTDKAKSGESRLPSSLSLTNAAQVSFKTLKEELSKVSLLLKETEIQAKKIVDECSADQRNPFEVNTRKFQTSAKQRIFDVNHQMEKAQTAFCDTFEYFQWKTDDSKRSPKEFFSLWANFIEDVKSCIKLEKQQQQLVKKNFKKVEHLNQIRDIATKFRKRRQSVEIIR